MASSTWLLVSEKLQSFSLADIRYSALNLFILISNDIHHSHVGFWRPDWQFKSLLHCRFKCRRATLLMERSVADTKNACVADKRFSKRFSIYNCKLPSTRNQSSLCSWTTANENSEIYLVVNFSLERNNQSKTFRINWCPQSSPESSLALTRWPKSQKTLVTRLPSSETKTSAGSSGLLGRSSKGSLYEIYVTYMSRRGLMATLETLKFDNLALRSLPIDKETKNVIRQVKGACYSLVEPTPVTNPRLVACSLPAMSLLDLPLSEVSRPEFVQCMSGNRLLLGSKTAAHCYCGHQAGYFSGQLGDGAAM